MSAVAFYLGLVLIVAGIAVMLVRAIGKAPATAKFNALAVKDPKDVSLGDVLKALPEIMKLLPDVLERVGLLMMVAGLVLVIVFKS